jgi:hypothetical protein
VPRDLPETTVAVRDLGGGGALAAGSGHDKAATYAVLYGGGDEPADWLLAGEALGALWLAAVEHGVTLLPLSGPVEVPFARHELGRLIGDVGLAYLVVRLGLPSTAGEVPDATPRLPIEQIIDVRD